MTRKEFETGVVKVYQLIYANYGDQRKDSLELSRAAIELVLIEYPKIFKINDKKYAAALPNILARVPIILQHCSDIYTQAIVLCVIATRYTQPVSRFFFLKIIYWFYRCPRLRIIDPQYFDK